MNPDPGKHTIPTRFRSATLSQTNSHCVKINLNLRIKTQACHAAGADRLGFYVEIQIIFEQLYVTKQQHQSIY